MAIVKLTKSKKALLFIDDDGNSYITSFNFVMGLAYNKAEHGFVLLKRFPEKVAENRFMKSPLYLPEGMELNPQTTEERVTTTNDSLSVNTTKDKEKKQMVEDIKVW